MVSGFRRMYSVLLHISRYFSKAWCHHQFLIIFEKHRAGASLLYRKGRYGAIAEFLD